MTSRLVGGNEESYGAGSDCSPSPLLNQYLGLKESGENLRLQELVPDSQLDDPISDLPIYVLIIREIGVSPGYQ